MIAKRFMQRRLLRSHSQLCLEKSIREINNKKDDKKDE